MADRDRAIAAATRLVVGKRFDEYVAASRAHAAGAITEAAFEPVRRGFQSTLERRREQIAEAAVAILRGPAPAQRCQAAHRVAGELRRCGAAATTAIAGKSFCDACAPLVPREPIPARGVA